MKHPALKNYFSVRCVQTIGELWGILHKDKSVFVRSWNRVHPCKFFLNNDIYFTIKRLEEMIENREFYQVVKKDSQNEVQQLGYQMMEVNRSTLTLEDVSMAMWELMGVPAKHFNQKAFKL